MALNEPLGPRRGRSTSRPRPGRTRAEVCDPDARDSDHAHAKTPGAPSPTAAGPPCTLEDLDSDLHILFGPAPLPPDRAAECVLTVLEDDGARLLDDYAEVRRDAYGLGRDTFDVIAGAKDLRGPGDFVDRVRVRGSGQARLRLPRFADDEVRALFFVDPPGGRATTLVLHCIAAADASPIARLLAGRPEHDDEREEAIVLLARVAAAIGADYFFAGASLVEWRRVAAPRLLGGPDDDFSPALLAWRAGLFGRQQLARAWGFDAGDVGRGARGFERVWL